MVLTPEKQHLLAVGFWVLLILVATIALRWTCSTFGEDAPSWRWALFMSVAVAGACYLTAEFASYVIMRTMDGVLLTVPPGYGFTHWLQEPFALKWAIISRIPFIRYLPFVFALCVAGMLQTILLDLRTTFRMSLFIFLVQWAITLVVMGVVSGVSHLALSQLATPPENAEQPPPASVEQDGTLAPKANLDEVRVTAQNCWDNLAAVTDPYLVEVKEALEPLTSLLPQSVQDFLNDGGWWLVVAVVVVLSFIWLRKLLLLGRRLFRPRKRKKKGRTVRYDIDLREDISELQHVYTEEAPQRLTIKGIAGRLRLIVLSQASRTEEGLSEEMVDPILDWIRPGLSAITEHDVPRIRLWPPHHTAEGFDLAFAQNVPIPLKRGQRSPWVLVSGRVQIGAVKINVGLAFYLDQLTSEHHVKIREGSWLDVISIQKEKTMALV